jgi:putative permease
MTRKIIMISTAIMTTLLALAVLWQFQVVIIYVLISLALAAAIRPLMKRLDGRPVLFRITWIFAYVIVLGSFIFLLFLTGKSAVAEIQYLAQNLSAWNVWTLPKWLEETSFHQTLMAWLPAPNKLFKAITGDQGQLVLPATFVFLQNLGGAVTAGIVILFLSIYWSINQIHFERLWLSLLPSDQRKLARGIWRKIEPEVGAYIRGQIIESVLTGLLLGFGFWLIGSPYPTLLAVLGALVCFVPVIGSPVTVITVLLLGLMTSVPLSLFTVAYTLAVLIAMEMWVKPRLFKGIWENHVLTLILIITLANGLGIYGIIVAPILSIICQIIWSRLVSHRAVIGPADQISDLKERQARVWDKIKTMADEPLPLVTSSMKRLDDLIAKAEPVLQVNLAAESSELMSHPGQEENSGNTLAR